MSNNPKKKARAVRWKAEKEAESREPDMLRRAVGLPTDRELIRGDNRLQPIGVLNAP